MAQDLGWPESLGLAEAMAFQDPQHFAHSGVHWFRTIHNGFDLLDHSWRDGHGFDLLAALGPVLDCCLDCTAGMDLRPCFKLQLLDTPCMHPNLSCKVCFWKLVWKARRAERQQCMLWRKEMGRCKHGKTQQNQACKHSLQWHTFSFRKPVASSKLPRTHGPRLATVSASSGSLSWLGQGLRLGFPHEWLG